MIKIITKDFLKALQRCKSAVANKANLNYIKLTFANDYIYLESTNIDLTIKTSLEAAGIHEKIVVCFDANKLIEIVSMLSLYESINFDIDKSNFNTKITTDYNIGIKFSLIGFDSKIFPDTPIIDGVKPSLILGQIDLKNILESVRISSGVKDARQSMNGINVILNNKVVFVSTDSRRLSLYSEGGSYDKEISFLIPITAVNEVVKLLENNDNDVEIKLKNNRIAFDIPSNNLYIYSSLINAEFPDYSKVIPDKFSNSIIVDRSEFVSSVNRVSKLCDEILLKIFLTIEGDELTISTRSGLGSASDTIIAACDIDVFTMAMNYKFVLDACKCLYGERIRISFNQKQSPVKFEDIEEDDYFNIIMPMKLEDDNE